MTTRTAADWVHDLGDVPLDRIIFDPLPGSATEADLLRKVEVEKHLCELIDGTLVEKPMGLFESVLAMLLVHRLLKFVEPKALGIVSGGDGPMRLRMGLVRLPDVAFIASGKLRGLLPLEPIPSVAPDLAVEVISKSNTPREIANKIQEYFAAGTRLVWVIDPATRTARVHTPDEGKPREIAADGVLKGEEVLPGFEVGLKELFEATDRMLSGQR